MRKIFVVFLSIPIILSGLSGCGFVGLAPDGPESVQIDNKTYKTGFYGTLGPYKFSLTEQMEQGDDLTLVRIDHDIFNLYYADVGPYVQGTIYCEESQYEQVSAYYSNPANYTYFCVLGANTTDEAKTTALSDVDTALFDDLLSFAEKSRYDPFDNRHNSEVETVELPMPDDTADTRMIFYKESKDSLFCSTRGDEYYNIDNALYMVYQYDFGYGEYEKLIAVKVPEYIGNYFISLMKSAASIS